MRNIIVIIVLAIISINCKAESALQIYLPREVTINSASPNLGQVAIIRGKESLATIAEQVTLGQFSSPGQKITLNRSIVLSRLACSGIPASEVTLTGAEEVTVSQQHQIINGEKFLEAAISYLTENPPHESVCKYNAVRAPADLILQEANGDIRLEAKLAESNIKNQANVIVTVFSGEQEAGSREAAFILKYNCRKAVTTVDIPAGAIISSENVRVENTVSNNPEPANWAVPYGLAVKRPVPANTEISMGMAEPVKPEIILKRNQNVLIKVDRLGLLVTAMGKTLQEGRAGEYIKVQNLSSQRVILAIVNEDGSVEPVF
ncbi:MAG: flagella basal body P-ring formation protein FlgA [Planctomycetes bacterium GWF2_41_51]|nr:MAG: flagella basal body P-ring formation protein FlgA [Planctomycetes bacterium GWF2_41_51]